jgi:diadenosine tetraphosphatase ApaH/serine/threonine PP2A family protein phosphatase
MRIAVFSDIHANWEAFRAVQEDMRKARVDRTVFLGDVVGYGPDPSRCLEEVRGMKCPVIRGNHDDVVAVDKSIHDFNPLAQEGVYYSRAELDQGQREWLDRMPMIVRFRGAIFTHSSLWHPEEFPYITSIEEAWLHFKEQRHRLSFCGHTHYPGVWEKRNEINVYPARRKAFRLQEGMKYLVNVGSVGQPRDGIANACYVVWDDTEQTISHRRVPYDIDSAYRRIVAAGLPPLLGERLYLGR